MTKMKAEEKSMHVKNATRLTQEMSPASLQLLVGVNTGTHRFLYPLLFRIGVYAEVR